VLILTKGEDGTVEATELSEIEQLGELEVVEAQLAELLAEEDVVNLAAAGVPRRAQQLDVSLIWPLIGPPTPTLRRNHPREGDSPSPCRRVGCRGNSRSRTTE